MVAKSNSLTIHSIGKLAIQYIDELRKHAVSRE